MDDPSFMYKENSIKIHSEEYGAIDTRGLKISRKKGKGRFYTQGTVRSRSQCMWFGGDY